MAAKSPTTLNTSRNRALAIGTESSKFAEPDMSGFPTHNQVTGTPDKPTLPMGPVAPCTVKL